MAQVGLAFRHGSWGGGNDGALSAFALVLGLQVSDLFPSADPRHAWPGAVWPGTFGVQRVFAVADWHLIAFPSLLTDSPASASREIAFFFPEFDEQRWYEQEEPRLRRGRLFQSAQERLLGAQPAQVTPVAGQGVVLAWQPCGHCPGAAGTELCCVPGSEEGESSVVLPGTRLVVKRAGAGRLWEEFPQQCSC